MDTLGRAIQISLVIVFLVGCSSTNATEIPIPTSSQFSQPVPTIEERQRDTTLPIFTPIPNLTPDITLTAFVQDMGTALVAEETLIAQYPRICDNLSFPREFSPNRLWMVESCYSENDESLILTMSNRESYTLWKLVYRDFIQQGEVVPDGGLSVVYWSDDGRFAYFNSFISGSGGYCFFSGNVLNYGKGLFRLDLNTGISTVILPLQENFIGYDFSFSPSGTQLVYETHLSGVKVLDLETGNIVTVLSVSEFDGVGGFFWSPNSVQIIYSAVKSINYGESIIYSLRLADTQLGYEKMIFESKENCFATRLWSDYDILTVERYDENYDRIIVEFDLNSNEIISEATVTPFP
jgi:hypothetical protein